MIKILKINFYVRNIKKFEGFSKFFFDNYCESCIYSQDDNDIIIRFDDIKIEEQKIELLLKKIKKKIIILYILKNLILYM